MAEEAPADAQVAEEQNSIKVYLSGNSGNKEVRGYIEEYKKVY